MQKNVLQIFLEKERRVIIVKLQILAEKKIELNRNEIENQPDVIYS